MLRVACSLQVYLTFLCLVQCQCNQIVDSDVDFNINNSKDVSKSKQGLNPYSRDHSVQFLPTSASVSTVETQSQTSLHSSKSQPRQGARTRRQLFNQKHSNDVKEPYSWSHTFNMEWNLPASYSKESAYIYNENTKRLKYVLEKDTEFQFLNPSCLRISIPDANSNMKVVDFRGKLNEEFLDNDGGHYSPIADRSGGRRIYYIPQLRVKQGDKVYYRLRVKFGKEGFDATVKGLLEVTQGNPHVGGPRTESNPFCSGVAAVRPQNQLYTTGLAPSTGGFVWNHQFDVSATNNGQFTKDSAKNWGSYAEYLKNILEKSVEFKFLNPQGLMISIPDTSTDMRIVDFRAKLNDEFRENDGGHFAPSITKRNGRWTYVIPQLSVVQGDTVYYRMYVKLGKEGLDATVRGVLEITQGNPHTQSGSLPVSHIYQPVPHPQPSMSVNQPMSSIPIQHPQTSHVGNSYPPVGQESTKGGESFSWDHKFISVNLNSTKDGFTKEVADRWLDKEDNIFKEKDIDFEFLNPTGLNILVSGDTKEVLDFNIKLNEEINYLEPGQFWPNKTRLADGRYSFYYPSLKLKQGDKVYYWMRVRVGPEMWVYNVKGKLQISKGSPHTGSNFGGTTSAPFYYPKTQPPPVATYPSNAGGLGNSKGTAASPVTWVHRFTIDNGGFIQDSANTWPEDVQRLKNKLEKEIEFKFLNPTGLRISMLGEDKDLKILAFNIKVNEPFQNLESGDFVANITMMRDGRWSYYYPNVRVKHGDKVYYWMRVTFGKQESEIIVRGELEITRGNPHKTGPYAEVPPPILLTQTQYPSTQTPVPQVIYQPTNQVSQTIDQPQNQLSQTQAPIPESNNKPANQVPQTEDIDVRFGGQPPSQPSQAPVPVSQNNNQPPNQIPLTQVPSSPTFQTQNCDTSESSQNGESSSPCVKVVTQYNPSNGQPIHITIEGEHPVHISFGAPLSGNNNPLQPMNKS